MVCPGTSLSDRIALWSSALIPNWQAVGRTKQRRKMQDNQQPPPPFFASDLYDACLEMNWERAKKLAQCQPHLAHHQEGDNLETPLYVACQNQPPVDLVQDLLRAYPESVYTKSRQGEIPLHIACRFQASVSVIRCLVHNHPATACLRNRWGTTPVATLWERPHPEIQCFCKTLALRQGISLEDKLAAIRTVSNDNTEMGPITQILLEAVARHRNQISFNHEIPHDNQKRLGLVHAAVSLGSTGCPLFVLFHVFAHLSDDDSVRDTVGRLPLHIAVGPDNSSLPKELWRFKPREYWSFKLCLHFHPGSALLTDPNEPLGRYPLHTALIYHHQWTEGVEDLVKAAPQVLSMRDPVTGIVPFLIAAQQNSKGSRDSNTKKSSNVADGDFSALWTTYNVLRADPAVLEHIWYDHFPSPRIFASKDAVKEHKTSCPYTEYDYRIWCVGFFGLGLAIFTVDVCSVLMQLLVPLE